MPENQEYSFQISVSDQAYQKKEQAKAAISKMNFQPRSLSVNQFIQLASNGHAFCYLFRGNRRKPELFEGTQSIIYDIDHSPIPLDEYVDALPHKPTASYTSFSNGQDNQYSFRLVYCLREVITDEPTFQVAYNTIAKKNGFGVELDRLRVNQLYFGSNSLLYGFQTHQTNIIYSLFDFDEFYDKGGNCLNVISYTTHPLHTNYDENNAPLGRKENDYYSNYVLSLETPFVSSDTGSHFCRPDSYYCVPIRFTTIDGKHVVKRWCDGEKRRNRLYVSARIMLMNVPELSLENLVFNLWQLIREYYDNTKDPITKEDVRKVARNAMAEREKDNISTTASGNQFKVNAEWCEANGISKRQAVPMITKERKQKEVLELYDYNQSVTDNYNALKEMGVSVSRSTLYRYVQETAPKSMRNLDCEIVTLLLQDPSLTNPALAKELDCDTSTIKRHLRKMKGQGVISKAQEGGKGGWVVNNTALQSYDLNATNGPKVAICGSEQEEM